MNPSLLTPQELKIMNILWSVHQGFVGEVLEHWPDQPKPAYNTVSTLVRILETKGFVSHEALGRSHRYFPTITKRQYQFRALRHMVEQVFNGSSKVLVARLLEDEQLSDVERSELMSLLQDREPS